MRTQAVWCVKNGLMSANPRYALAMRLIDRIFARLNGSSKGPLGETFGETLGETLGETMAHLRRGIIITGIGLVLGVIVAYAALAAFGTVRLMLDLWLPAHRPGDIGFNGIVWTVLLVPVIAGLAIGGLLLWLAPKKPVELADVIHAAHKTDPVVSRTGGYVSLLKSILAIGAGSTTGLYGPLVVLGASLAASTKRLLNLSPSYAEMALGAGAAAAISAAFSAPLAGILFAHEVILRHYSLRFFAPVTLASASAYVFSGTVLNQHISVLPMMQTRMAGVVDILLLIALGVAAGLLAVFVMKFWAALRALGQARAGRSDCRSCRPICAVHFRSGSGDHFGHDARRYRLFIAAGFAGSENRGRRRVPDAFVSWRRGGTGAVFRRCLGGFIRHDGGGARAGDRLYAGYRLICFGRYDGHRQLAFGRAGFGNFIGL